MLILDHQLEKHVSALVIKTNMHNTLAYLQALSRSSSFSYHVLQNTYVTIEQNDKGIYFYRIAEKKGEYEELNYNLLQPMYLDSDCLKGTTVVFIIQNVNKDWIRDQFALTPLQLYKWLQAHWERIIEQSE